MSDAPKDGGPAFPHIRKEVYPDCHEQITSGGMSLRDYFAGQALGGAIAEGRERSFGKSRCEELATFAYAAADAMLKARGES